MGFKHEFEPKILGFLCNWCCYAGADLAGVSRYQYPPNIRVIRLMCSGRVDPEFIIQSFLEGTDGVFIGGCWLGECHYGVEGNYHALGMVHILKKTLQLTGINPDRLRIEWVSASEGIRFAEVVSNFTARLKELGPLGAGEAKDGDELRFKLETVRDLVPQLKLVERERLRVHFDTEEEYAQFFDSEETNALFRDVVADKLAVNQIMTLLKRTPQSAAELSSTLGLNPSEAARHLKTSARQGLIRFDANRKLFFPVMG
jgi:NADH-quinone oxidoreductase subunit E